MKAIIKAEASNGKNFSGDKELVSTYNVVGRIKGELRAVVTARCYMGRSRNASTVYASIWVHGDDIYTSGHGKASGWGYHKESAAIADAITSAQIELRGQTYSGEDGRYFDGKEYRKESAKDFKHVTHFGGCGDTAIRSALCAIARAAGAKGKLLVVTN